MFLETPSTFCSLLKEFIICSLVHEIGFYSFVGPAFPYVSWCARHVHLFSVDEVCLFLFWMLEKHFEMQNFLKMTEYGDKQSENFA